MAEAETRATPLAPLEEALDATSAEGAVRLRTCPFLTLINLRGNASDPAFVKAVKRGLGLAVPDAPNTTLSGNGLRVLWLGPEEWLIVCGDGEQEGLSQRLKEALHGQHVSIVDISAHRTVLELAGPRARDVLEKGCLLDLHPRVFGPDQCVGTVIAKTQLYLEQMDDGPTYRLYVVRSFARHLASWLLDATAEFT